MESCNGHRTVMNALSIPALHCRSWVRFIRSGSEQPVMRTSCTAGHEQSLPVTMRTAVLARMVSTAFAVSLFSLPFSLCFSCTRPKPDSSLCLVRSSYYCCKSILRRWKSQVSIPSSTSAAIPWRWVELVVCIGACLVSASVFLCVWRTCICTYNSESVIYVLAL